MSFLFLGFLIAIILFVLINQWKTTTYGHVLEDLIVEEIEEIYIRHMKLEEIEERELTIDDKDQILKLVEEPSHMKIRSAKVEGNTEYFMIFKTDKDSYSVSIRDSNGIYIEGDYYEIIDNNLLLDVINTHENDWEEVER